MTLPCIRLKALFFLLIAAASAQAGDQWIVFAPPDFAAAIKPLAERRQQEQFDVAVISAPEVTNADFIMAHLKSSLSRPNTKTWALLAGTPPIVATCRGDVERMDGQETDAPFGLPGADGAPTIAVGRFPAQNAEELRAMTTKTLRFEDDRPAAGWREGLFLMVGNPGGGMLPEIYVQGTVDTDLERLNPAWSVRALFNVPSSRFFYPPPYAPGAARAMFEQGALFSIYLGHSNADAMDFLGRHGFQSMSIEHGAGPFFTCGCFALQSKNGETGYGLEALRNPNGPSAIIGATGESYSAAGQLAAEGLLTCFAHDPAPERLGDYWQAAMTGLARGKMDPGIYAILDAADGSHGKESLNTMRREHLQMWMLLGDPAMRMPILPQDVMIDTPASATPGKTITISGLVPKRLEGAKIRVALERPANSHPSGLKNVSSVTAQNQEEVAQTIVSNNACANNYLIAMARTTATGNRFSTSITLPDNLPWKTVVAKVSAAQGNEAGCGVRALKIAEKQQSNSAP